MYIKKITANKLATKSFKIQPRKKVLHVKSPHYPSAWLKSKDFNRTKLHIDHIVCKNRRVKMSSQLF